MEGRTDYEEEELVEPEMTYTVSEITLLIKGSLELYLPYFQVRGEVSNLRTPTSGHSYFTLKDEESQLRCVLFRGRGEGLRPGLADGMEIVVSGRIGVYEKRGEYQLLADDFRSVGLGALQLKYEELKKRLISEGLFDRERKRPIPSFVQRVGVVTSPTGAAIRDILKVMERRFSNVEVVLFPVRVQGDGAAQEIASAIDRMNEVGGFDCLIVGRGGGSVEDLWAFNEEVVARAVHRSRIPVISAVGHEIDYTIADFVADLRAPTPSAAAEIVVQNRDELVDKIEDLKDRIVSSFRGILDSNRLRLRTLGPDRFSRRLIDRIGQYRMTADDLRDELVKGMSRRLEGCRDRAEVLLGKVDALNPAAVLKRGYSIARKMPGGDVIKDASSLSPQDDVEVRLATGVMECKVVAVRADL